MNGEQEGSELPVEVGLRGKDTDWEGAGATTTLPALNKWGDRPSEEEGACPGLTPNSDWPPLTGAWESLHRVLRPRACVQPEGVPGLIWGCGPNDSFLYSQCLAQGWPQSKRIINVC